MRPDHFPLDQVPMLQSRVSDLEKRVAGLEDLVFSLSTWLKDHAEDVPPQWRASAAVIPFSLSAKQRAIFKSVILPENELKS